MEILNFFLQWKLEKKSVVFSPRGLSRPFLVEVDGLKKSIFSLLEAS
jgi:hypothetical protein